MGDMGNDFDEIMGLADEAGSCLPPVPPAEAATHDAAVADPDPSRDPDAESAETAEECGDVEDSAESGDAMDSEESDENGDPEESAAAGIE